MPPSAPWSGRWSAIRAELALQLGQGFVQHPLYGRGTDLERRSRAAVAPAVEHYVPLFITLGAATDPAAPPTTVIDGYFYGLAKRSFQVA